MVNFRYHVVSLIAVLLALAVGVILGAGPLQNSINNMLSNDVDELKAQVIQLEGENGRLQAERNMQDEALTVAAPQLVGKALDGKKVAIVNLPNAAADEESKAVADMLGEAGAKVTGNVTILPAWTAAADTPFRTAFAETIAEYVAGADDAEANDILGAALNQLTRLGMEDPKNEVLSGLLTGSDTPMVKVEGLNEPADAIILVAPNPTSKPAEDAEATATADVQDANAQTKYELDTYTALAAQLDAQGPTVLLGYADTPEDLTAHVRTNAAKVSTVDTPGNVASAINLVFAVAHEVNGDIVHYGVANGAETPLGKAPVVKENPNDDGADTKGDGGDK